MSDIDFQIFTREPVSGKEREPNEGWNEFPKRRNGWYDTDKPIWVRDKKNPENGVFLILDGHKPNRIVFLNKDRDSEIWLGNIPIIKREQPHQALPWLTIIPSSASSDWQWGGVEITKADETLEFAIINNGDVVKEIKIVSVASEWE